MEQIVIYLSMVLKSINSINAAPLCLGNASKDFLTNNMKNTRLYGYVYG